jgi:hypothetical protein
MNARPGAKEICNASSTHSTAKDAARRAEVPDWAKQLLMFNRVGCRIAWRDSSSETWHLVVMYSGCCRARLPLDFVEHIMYIYH